MSNEHNSPGDPRDDTTEWISSSGQAHQSIGPYRLKQRLGIGGMGDVWLAEQTTPVRRQVAIKLIKSGMDTAQVVSRFEAERQALAVMEHPCVAKILDAGSTPDGRPYFAMEYVRGEPITSYCDQHRLTLQDRLRLFIELCEGVQHAHQKGIIHRDLKPSNILVTIQGDRAVPRIIDFGIAKATAQPLTNRSLFTELGMLIGTPEYMSPEQAQVTSLDIDTRSDIYSLGVILHELLTGVLPFDLQAKRVEGIDEVRKTIREQEPQRPSTRVRTLGVSAHDIASDRGTDEGKLAAALRVDLDWIILKALSKDRTRRYESAAAFAADLSRYLRNEPVQARPPSLKYKAGKFVRRHRLGVGIGAAVVLLLAGGIILTAVQAQRIARERDRADGEAAAATEVAQFLAGLFTASDPSEARGSKLTAQDLLARGAHDLQQTLQGQPEMRARLQSTIGDVYTNMGMFAEAKPLLEDALVTQRRILGADASQTITTMHRIANLKWYVGELKDAELLYQEVVQRRQRLLGEDHRDTMRANFDLASLYALQKRYSDAERLTIATLEKQRRVLGNEHPDTLNSLNNLQSILFRQGQYLKAEPIAREGLAAQTRQFGENHPYTIQGLHNLAAIYRELGEYDKAEALLTKAVEGYRRVLGDDHPETCRSFALLAAVYRRQHRYEQAEAAAVRSYDGYARKFGVQHENTTTAALELARLYDEWGKHQKAATWKARAEKVVADKVR